MRTRAIHLLLMCYASVIGLMVWAGATQARASMTRDRDITVANLNILHGVACDFRRLLADESEMPAEERQCRIKDRIALLAQHIIAAHCPDVITLQENVTNAFVFLPHPAKPTELVRVGPLENTVALIKAELHNLAKACGFRYHLVFDPEGATQNAPTSPQVPMPRGVDEELILSRYPVKEAQVALLYSPFSPFFSRHVLFARIHHPVEPLDVFTTHLAAGADLGDVRCRELGSLPLPTPPTPCPEVCEASDTVRECQAKQVADFVEARHTIPGVALLTGDFNASPSSKVYKEFAARGWLDSHLEAHNRECNPVTGRHCTAGREDDNLSELESTALNQTERIDYIFVIPPDRQTARCEATFDRRRDRDRDGTATGLFANGPNPFVAQCGGAAPRPICWPSDHSGNQLDLDCRDDRTFRRLGS